MGISATIDFMRVFSSYPQRAKAEGKLEPSSGAWVVRKKAGSPLFLTSARHRCANSSKLAERAAQGCANKIKASLVVGFIFEVAMSDLIKGLLPILGDLSQAVDANDAKRIALSSGSFF